MGVDSIVDLLPPGFVFQGVTAGSGVTTANSGSRPSPGATGRLTWIGGNNGFLIAPSSLLHLEYTATIGPVPGTYVNTATPYVGETALPTALDTVVVMPSADLATTLAGPTFAYAGDTITYVLQVRNLGPNPGDTVAASNTLPPGATLVRATRGGTVGEDGGVRWPALANLAVNATRTDTVWIVPTTPGTHILAGAATSTTHDPAHGNNDGSAEASRISLMVSGVGVVVTPDGLEAPHRELPGTRYSKTFTVTSGFDVEETFDLLAAIRLAAANAHLTIDSIGVAGPAAVSGDSGQITLPARDSANVMVWYTIAPGQPQTDTLYLTARSVTRPRGKEDGFMELRRSIPIVVLTRKVNTGANVRPGVDIFHTIMVSNSGEMAAHEVVVVDDLSRQVEFKLNSAAAVTLEQPEITSVTIRYSDDGTSWDYALASGGCGGSPGYDACVRAVRWEFQGNLAANTLPTSSQLIFTVRVR